MSLYAGLRGRSGKTKGSHRDAARGEGADAWEAAGRIAFGGYGEEDQKGREDDAR